jgi:hypothetical protein
MLHSVTCQSAVRAGEGLPDNLPRLCYIGSLQVEATSASMMLLYRLLESYPADRLRVVFTKEDDRLPENPERRLPRVRYHEVRPAFDRGWFFARNRLPRLFWHCLAQHASWQAQKISALVEDFQPEAILTLHEQFGWISAVKVARILNLPLHFLLHDEWYRNLPMSASLRPRFDQMFRTAYGLAASRFCISPYMAAAYAERFGTPGSVLYPTRSRSAAKFSSPPRPRESTTLRVAYGGNIFHRGYWVALRELADALAIINGELFLYGPAADDVARNGLDRNNVHTFGFVYNLIEEFRSQADVLFLPMTFEQHERPNMEISFPSKLTEYTAAGLPLLVYGPPYCSAVRWAYDNLGVAEIVSTPGLDEILAALKRLSSADRRSQLGQRALELGQRYFSAEAGTAALHAGLRAANAVSSEDTVTK